MIEIAQITFVPCATPVWWQDFVHAHLWCAADLRESMNGRKRVLSMFPRLVGSIQINVRFPNLQLWATCVSVSLKALYIGKYIAHAVVYYKIL